MKMLQKDEIPLIVRWVLFLVGEILWGFAWACVLDTEEGPPIVKARTDGGLTVGCGRAYSKGMSWTGERPGRRPGSVPHMGTAGG